MKTCEVHGVENCQACKWRPGLFAAAVLVCLSATPASAQTCAQVRQAVAYYGYARAAAWARVNLTPVQIRAALRCLRTARR